MIEVIIKITGNTLLNDKVDELIKVTRQIQETEESLDTKMEIKKKKENIKKDKKKIEVEEQEDVYNISEIDDDLNRNIYNEDEEDYSSSIDELKKDAKTLFIKLTKKDKPKARNLLENYDVGGFSELDKVFKDDFVKWGDFIKLLKEYVG